jgi:hypothetical protein
MKAADRLSDVVPHGRGVRKCIPRHNPTAIDWIIQNSFILSTVVFMMRWCCSYVDGTVYDGQWNMGVRSGTAMVTHANGSIFNGSYAGDVACGEGTFTYPGGQVEVRGTWLQGQLHGEVGVLAAVMCRLNVHSRCFFVQVVPATNPQPHGLSSSCLAHSHASVLQVAVVTAGQEEKQLWTMGKRVVDGGEVKNA